MRGEIPDDTEDSSAGKKRGGTVRDLRSEPE